MAAVWLARRSTAGSLSAAVMLRCTARAHIPPSSSLPCRSFLGRSLPLRNFSRSLPFSEGGPEKPTVDPEEPCYILKDGAHIHHMHHPDSTTEKTYLLFDEEKGKEDLVENERLHASLFFEEKGEKSNQGTVVKMFADVDAEDYRGNSMYMTEDVVQKIDDVGSPERGACLLFSHIFG
jgi:hypothetical protein